MVEGYGQWADSYLRNGWVHVLPLPARAKTPPPGGYTGRKADKTPDAAKIAEWKQQYPNGNLALRMPDDIIGIDVDDYEYQYQARNPETKEKLWLPDGAPDMRTGVKTGNITLGGLEDELGELPATWRSSSRGDGPSGIRLYRVPSGLLWGDFGLHIECIWWGHRYAVVWPSVNPDSGLRYLWINDDDPDSDWSGVSPHVEQIPKLPQPWIDRFGREPDAPKPAKPAAPGLAVEVHNHNTTVNVTVVNDDRPHQFTREQAARYVETEGLEPLRRAPHGSINNQMNNAAVVLSHFVPRFWSPAAAHALVWDAAQTAGYDDPRSATKTIDSGLATVSWVAELVSEPSRPPGGARTRPRDSEEDPWPTEAPDDTPPEAAGFWDARPALAFIRDFALHRYAAPWAVLGATLARAVACVEPNIQLPAVIGTEASLNLFVGLVGISGGGKDIASGVAKALLLPMNGRDPIPLDVIPLGSGEGLSHVYMRMPPKLSKKKGAVDEDSAAIGLGFTNGDPNQAIQYRTRALINIAEIDTMGSLSQRRGSTIGGQLRQAWSGSQLGFQYVTDEKRMIVPEHAYRMCLTAGIQPGRAGVLLDETDGGTPQRFLWLPATNPGLEEPTDEQIDNPPPGMTGQEWSPPQYRAGQVSFKVCSTARRTIVRAHVARGRGDGNALDGHALLNRLKTAAALAILCGDNPQRQCEVTDDDWEMAGVIMAVSDATRASVQRELAEQAREENKQRAIAEAHKVLTVESKLEDVGVKRASTWLRGKIGEEWVTEQALRSKIKGNLKKYLGEALDALAAAGEIETGEYQANNGTARHARRKGSSGG